MDNKDVKTATNVPVAADEVTYSGDTGQLVQIVRHVGVSGAEGAKTVVEIPVSAINGMKVDPFGPGTIDSFGHLVTGTVNNAVDIQFFRDTPANLVTVTSGTGGTATATGGMATFACTTSASSFAKGVTTMDAVYTAGSEIYCIFTAAFTGTGAGTSRQLIGLYDTNNGFFIGFSAATFNATVRKGAADTSVAKASFSVDTLVGGATSKFTRNGTPEAIDLTKLNVWRIRFGWVGSAPINFEVLAPDGHWVTFHQIKQPNNAALPSIEDADLPVTCDVNGGNSAAALTIITNCWCAGTTQKMSKLNATLTSASLADLTRAVIAGESSGGGGGFVNVKVSPSGTLQTSAAVSDVIPGTAATNLGKAEDAQHTTGDVGVMALGVRNDANAALSGTDLDYTPYSTDSRGNVNTMGRKHVVTSSVASAGLTTASTAYATGDQMGTIFTLTGMARDSGGSGAITSVKLIDAADVIGSVDVVFFTSSVTLASDNAVFSVSDADALTLVAVVQLAGAYDLTNNRLCQMFNLFIPYTCVSGTSLYAAIITRASHTFFAAVGNLQLITTSELN